jgi:hypothetical protein
VHARTDAHRFHRDLFLLRRTLEYTQPSAQHTAAYIRKHQHTSAYVEPMLRQELEYTQPFVAAYVSIRQHTSAYVSIIPAYYARRQLRLCPQKHTRTTVSLTMNQLTTSAGRPNGWGGVSRSGGAGGGGQTVQVQRHFVVLCHNATEATLRGDFDTNNLLQGRVDVLCRCVCVRACVRACLCRCRCRCLCLSVCLSVKAACA